MIVGSVNARLDAILQIQVEDSSGHMHTFDTIIDTGFTGHLTLRIAQISALGLSWYGEIVGQMANGSQQRIDIFDAILWWDCNPLQIKIDAVEADSLLGTRLLEGHQVKIDFVPGGSVTIEPIP